MLSDGLHAVSGDQWGHASFWGEWGLFHVGASRQNWENDIHDLT